MNTTAFTNKICAALFVLLAVFAITSTGWATTYYVSTTGSYNNPGTQAQPWNVQKAIDAAVAGDTVYFREGSYSGRQDCWWIQHSGTQSQPITFTNYPGEQAVFRHSTVRSPGQFWANGIFCGGNSDYSKHIDYIKIIGTDVPAHNLTLHDSTTLTSTKGMVIQGTPFKEYIDYCDDGTHTPDTWVTAERGHSIVSYGGDYWEVAGVDFVEVGGALRTWSERSPTRDSETIHWNMHDCRVFRFFTENGAQFNGSYNTVSNNQFYRDGAVKSICWGLAAINFLGHDNVVSGNLFDLSNTPEGGFGIGFEWNLVNNNLIERNITLNANGPGLFMSDGDNNIIRNNIFISTNNDLSGYRGGIELLSYGNNNHSWPCENYTDTNPVGCYAHDNQIYNNVVYGYKTSIQFNDTAPPGGTTTIRNNAFIGWRRGTVCVINGACSSIPGVVLSNNVSSGTFGFVDAANYNFHLLSTSPLIGAGYNLGSLVPNDFDGNIRPQGSGFDIGAHEFVSSQTPVPSAPKGFKLVN